MTSPVPDPAMDEFAQTRGADDLFDDEIIPASAEEQVHQSQAEVEVQETPDRHDGDSQPAPHDTAEPSRDAQPKSKRGGRPVWRGKRRVDRTANKAAETSGGQEEAVEHSTETPEEQPAQEDDTQLGSKQPAEANQHVPAVRGDRSATGGVRKPKLTAEELDKRIASARENAAKVAAAHARAQADLASFLEREKVEDEKRRIEGENRRVMDSERAQNRERKLKAVTGREWDATKREEDYSPRGGRGYRRGMHGAVAGSPRRDFEQHADAPANRGLANRRGRRGRGGRRGSPRGDSASDRASEEPGEPAPPPAPAMPSETDFPVLGGEKKEEATEQAESKSPRPRRSWAEQMEGDR